MNEMQLMAVKVDSLFYEEAVDDLVRLIMDTPDTPRELHLLDGSIMIMENLSTTGRIASLAIMAVVMLAEERKKNERHHERGPQG
jgi:hypothetical protein